MELRQINKVDRIVNGKHNTNFQLFVPWVLKSNRMIWRAWTTIVFKYKEISSFVKVISRGGWMGGVVMVVSRWRTDWERTIRTDRDGTCIRMSCTQFVGIDSVFLINTSQGCSFEANIDSWLDVWSSVRVGWFLDFTVPSTIQGHLSTCCCAGLGVKGTDDE